MKQTLRRFLTMLTPAQIIVAYYFLAVSVSMILLSLPIAIKPGVKWTFMDALFTAVSAVSVTGLSTVSMVETFTDKGIYILMFVLQFGGIGVMTLGTFFWLIIGRKIGLRERRLIMTDQNQSSLAGLVKLLKQILVIIILIELMGAIILGTYFLKYYSNWEEAFLHGLFASVSATTNAGFDITGESLVPFANDYFVQLVSILLIILGSIGFPVLVETKEFLFSRNDKKSHFSLNTKLTTVTFLGLLILGTIVIVFLEFDHFFKDKSWYASFFYAFFHSTTTKSAGLTTMDINQFTEPTLLFIAALMFIGASPSSTGGGIRVTTLALNLLFFFHFARGNRNIKIFKRELHEDDIIKSLVVSMMALFICFTSVFILYITEELPLLPLIFEVASAFGTTGLSMGITADLSIVGKVIIMLLMFIGRVGMISFLLIIGGKRVVPNYHYPKERVIIG
ncbi:TrkH family potassium uptake protein [Pseudoneobacillus sp. C159]